MSTSDDVQPTAPVPSEPASVDSSGHGSVPAGEHPDSIPGTAERGDTTPGLDEVGQPAGVPDGVGPDGEPQSPPLPDWGPTDGTHGTDKDPQV